MSETKTIDADFYSYDINSFVSYEEAMELTGKKRSVLQALFNSKEFPKEAIKEAPSGVQIKKTFLLKEIVKYYPILSSKKENKKQTIVSEDETVKLKIELGQLKKELEMTKTNHTEVVSQMEQRIHYLETKIKEMGKLNFALSYHVGQLSKKTWIDKITGRQKPTQNDFLSLLD